MVVLCGVTGGSAAARKESVGCDRLIWVDGSLQVDQLNS